MLVVKVIEKYSMLVCSNSICYYDTMTLVVTLTGQTDSICTDGYNAISEYHGCGICLAELVGSHWIGTANMIILTYIRRSLLRCTV